MTLDEFLNKYLGQSNGYPEGQYVGECLSIVKLYIKECFGILPPPSGTNSAYGYWSNFPNPLGDVFEKVLNTDELIPEKGWIAIWKPWSANQYGHIAIVADGSTTSILKNYAQNWTSKTFQLESNRYTNVIGFLKPKESIIQDMTDEQKRILDFIIERKLTEGQIRQAADWLRDNTVANLETQITGLKTTISDQYKEMDKKNLEYGKLLEDFNILMAKYQALEESTLNKQTEDESAKFSKLSFGEMFELMLKKLFIRK